MKKIIYIISSFIFFFGFILNSFAEENIDIKFPKNIDINKVLELDLTQINKNLQEKYESPILFEYNIKGEQTINSIIFKKKFKTFGEKEINLNIYKLINNEKELILNKKITIFVYKDKINAIYDISEKKSFIEFFKKAKESGILINSIGIKNFEIPKLKFKELFLKNLDINNYLLIYGNKEFIFDLLSKINRDNINKQINIVGISSFNINILEKYLGNFLINKKWLAKGILLDKTAQLEILKETKDINKLIKIIKDDKYNYIELNTKNQINSILFLSKFVNNLSNIGFSTNNIYIFLIIPFIFLVIVIFKHLIGLTPSGVLIPLVLTILFFKLNIIISISFLIIFVILNILLSKIISKYSLHYTPKILILEIINILIFVIILNLLIENQLIYIDINDIMLLIFFIIISERLISIIVSKEFSEYKHSLLNTIILSIITYLIFNLSFIKTIILTYPEIILIIIPILFMIGKFTGLRITEYFRFKEIIKNIEE